MKIADIFAMRPYTYKRVGRLSAFFFPSWIIECDETPIREFSGPRIEVEELVKLMNAAYCNGFSSGVIRASAYQDVIS